MTPTIFKTAVTKALAAAAAASLVVAGLAVAGPGSGGRGETPIDALLTAAEETASVGSADVQVTGNASTTVRLTDLDEFLEQVPDADELVDRIDEALPIDPPGGDAGQRDHAVPSDGSALPGLSDLPELSLPEVDCDGLSDDLCDELRNAMSEAKARLDAQRNGSEQPPAARPEAPDPEAVRDRFDAERAAAREEMRRQLAAAQAQFEQELDEIPREFTCDFRFEGSGTMTIPGTVELGGEADVTCDPEFVDATGDFHSIISQDVTFSSSGDGAFTASPTRGEIGSIVADGRSIAELLRRSENDDASPEDHGTEELDGVTVRHLSYSTTTGHGTVSVDVWIGVDDHIVRKLVTRTTGQASEQGVEAEWTAEQILFVSNVEAPSAEVDVPHFEDVVPVPPAVEALNGKTNPFGDAIPVFDFGSGGASS